ncbi:MAG: GTP-binding protein [Leptolyngbyaceae cyanobacterium MO_188.B28]|nr:GTP-binding protein [Leptolyngbyaceae cyanobacterium MO_188.B28]
MSLSELLPDLPNYDPEPADGVRVGESPVPGLTLKRILRGHTDYIGRIAWSPDGQFLASPSNDQTIRIWNVARGECTAVLKGHTNTVFSVAWSPDGQRLASAAGDKTIRLWNAANGQHLQTLEGHTNSVLSVAWSHDGQRLASASSDKTIRLWNAANGQHLQTLKGHTDSVFSVAWSPDGQRLASASVDDTIRIWNAGNGQHLQTLKGHTDSVFSVAWSPDGQRLASASSDKTIRIWNTLSGKQSQQLEGHTNEVKGVAFSNDGQLLASTGWSSTTQIRQCNTWKILGTITQKSSSALRSVAFQPNSLALATLAEGDSVICIWDINMDVLLSQTTTDYINYTTAKIVLVGDSGVGKTGLGWRLAHNDFKEHASTHGQQFWVIDELGETRDDGTECEAVLWDLAGQHVYRPIHSIFLDNVDASLVLFDPTNRQDPLKGAQFWLEQLKGKAQLPPSVLVGARMDRGGSTVSQEYLEQFCQQYGISGGYIGTSAKSGEGLDTLIQKLKAQIPWDEMTTTVTTVTFKRIKEYVLALKEKTDRQGVLVQSTELRQQLQANDPDWQFTDAEMMTAVGHLETHGYVTILKSSAGDTHILLAPDLLVDLASSIVVLADKHPRELGAISERDLLQGNYHFDELEGLAEVEQQVLFDAAVLRFLEHNVCFREAFENDILLIFPGLIKQKRPLDDDFPATDDVAYVVRGRVENLYAMLVVLLGYSPSFIRINHWQKQAQYELNPGEICGFRLIEDREGEIELVLCYSNQMPTHGREKFQELFEQFLYQREVQVNRFPPVRCEKNHQLERSAVMNLLSESQTFAFCSKCGSKVDLSDLDQSRNGIEVPLWLQKEAAKTRLRSTYEQHLAQIKGYRRGWEAPRCYLTFAPSQKHYANKLKKDLREAGVFIIESADQVQRNHFVVMLNAPTYQRAWNNPTPEFTSDIELVRTRLAHDQSKFFTINLEGNEGSSPLHDVDNCDANDFRDISHYPVSLFNLLLKLYAIPPTLAKFASLRASLHQQWEQIPVGTEERPPETRKRFDIALSFPGEYRDFVKIVAEELAGELGRDRIFYDAYYQAELARPNLDTYLQGIYHDQAELVVVFLCAEYERKEWCGLELRAVRDLLKQKKTAEIMLIRFDNTEIPGIFSIDGYVNAEDHEPLEMADLIAQRLRLNQQAT